jgi:hypothetical protein
MGGGNETLSVELEQKAATGAAAAAARNNGAGRKSGGTRVRAMAWYVVVAAVLAVLVHVLT